MIVLDKMSDEQFVRHALDILRRELGAGGLARFLRLHRSGLGDYSQDRVGWQRHMTVDQIVDSIRRQRS